MYPGRILAEKYDAALIVLNQDLDWQVFGRVWRNCAIRLCADGGANRLYDRLVTLRLDPADYLPHAIVGDLDSLREDVQRYYESKGVSVHHVESQYATDLQKCLSALERWDPPGKRLDVVIYGGLSGRFDQSMAVVGVLYRLGGDAADLDGLVRPERHAVVISNESLAVRLPAGQTTLRIGPDEGPTCGLLPIGTLAHIKTRGLRWDFDADSSFDGMLSTSNQLEAAAEGEGHLKRVTVDTSRAIIWTTELRRSSVQ